MRRDAAEFDRVTYSSPEPKLEMMSGLPYAASAHEDAMPSREGEGHGWRFGSPPEPRSARSGLPRRARRRVAQPGLLAKHLHGNLAAARVPESPELAAVAVTLAQE